LPYKNQLIEEKEKKRELEEARRSRLAKKNCKEKPDKKSAKGKHQNVTTRSTTSKPSTTEKRSSATTDSERFFCLYCHELYTDPPTEDWIQSYVCKKWAHETCAPVDSPDFTCDFCI